MNILTLTALEEMRSNIVQEAAETTDSEKQERCTKAVVLLHNMIKNTGTEEETRDVGIEYSHCDYEWSYGELAVITEYFTQLCQDHGWRELAEEFTENAVPVCLDEVAA